MKHPETSLRAPKGDSARNFSCGRAPSRRRVPRALSCACARLLSHPRQKNKENLTDWQPALIVLPPPFPSPWHCPAIQPDCLPTEQTTPHRGAEHPTIHPDPATDGPSGTTHNPPPAISIGRGFTPIWMSPSRCHQSQKLIKTLHSRASVSPGRMKAPVISLVSNSSIPKPPFAHLITNLILSLDPIPSPDPKSQPQFN